MTSDSERGAGELDSRGCRLLVASYSDVAPVVRAVATRARDRILQSPALGDFVDLSFADLGPRPGQREEPDQARGADAVTRIVTALTQPSQDPDLSYFALLITDRSAAAAAHLLASCDADPVIGALPMRRRVLASIDDRAPGTDTAIEVKLPPSRFWRRDNLVDEVQHYAEEVMKFFSAREQRGLTTTELDALRPLATELPSVVADEQVGNLADALAPPPPASVPVLPPPAPVPEPTTALAVPSSPARTPRSFSFPRLRMPQRRREPAPEPGPPAASVVVYLVLTVAESVPGRADWPRGRSVLLELDKRLARTPGIAYFTRVLSAGVPDQGRLALAGQLGARDISLPASFLDFAAALGSVPAVVRADCQHARPSSAAHVGTGPGHLRGGRPSRRRHYNRALHGARHEDPGTVDPVGCLRRTTIRCLPPREVRAREHRPSRYHRRARHADRGSDARPVSLVALGGSDLKPARRDLLRPPQAPCLHPTIWARAARRMRHNARPGQAACPNRRPAACLPEAVSVKILSHP